MADHEASPPRLDARPRPPQQVRERARARARRALFEGSSAEPSPPSDDEPAERTAAPAANLARGRVLGRYVVLSALGQGGMGTVFRAYDEALGRPVAIKLLHSGTDERHSRRLRREAQALAKLSHPHVVHVYEVAEADGQWFIAMEFVPGQTLRDWQGEARTWQECVEVYRQAGAGLAAAHAAGLVHRDFKPDNCIIDEQGRVRVLDFGLVQGAQLSPLDPSSGGSTQDSGSADTFSTRTGTLLGTVAYMPPEQLESHRVDARSDQFSFCVSLYEALYGERPFKAGALGRTSGSTQEIEIRAMARGAAVPVALRRILRRGLEADPSARWPSMEALLAELGALVTPSSRRWLTLGVVAGMVAVGASVVAYAWVGRRCEGAEAQLSGVWDGQRRAEVEAALMATELSYARDTWERVNEGLDQYAQRWVDHHVEACEATNVYREQSPQVMDLRMGCLRERRVALGEAVAVLSEPDVGRAERAISVVTKLPALSRCRDIEALEAQRPPPEDPEVAAQITTLRERLARVRVLDEAGAYQDAAALVDTVMAQAEGLEHAPLTAEVLLHRGRNHEYGGRFAEAERDLERAYLLATTHGHGSVEHRALSLLVFVTGLRQERHDVAAQWGKVALALARRPRAEPQATASTLNDIGRVLDRQGKTAEGLELLREALELQKSALGPEHREVAITLNSIGGMLRSLGELDEALDHQRRSLAIHQAVLGPRHPSIAIVLGNVGQVLAKQGKLGEALDHHRGALAIQREALGPTHATVANTHNNLGTVLREQGSYDEALEHHRAALAIQEDLLGAKHPRLAITLSNIGVVLSDQGKLDEALDHDRRALAIFEEALGPRHRIVGITLSNIGSVLMRQGELEESLTQLRRALSIKEETVGPEHTSVAYSLDNLGDALRRQGALSEALEHYGRALKIRETALGPRHPDLALSLVGLAQTELGRGSPGAARVHAERAISILDDAETSPHTLATAHFLLARALWVEPSQRTRARGLAERALASLSKNGHEQRDEVERWLAEHPVASP